MSTESTTPLPPEGDEPVAETRAFETGTYETKAYETKPYETRPDETRPDETVSDGESLAAPRERLRVGTVVWGLVLALAGAAVLAWGQGLRFDVQLAAIGVLAAAGALLVVSAVTRSKKRA